MLLTQKTHGTENRHQGKQGIINSPKFKTGKFLKLEIYMHKFRANTYEKI